MIITQRFATIKHTWVILDTCYTNSVSNNTILAKEIITYKSHKKLTVSTNRGRGNIPKVFAFENLYPLNTEESDLFYFLLIRTKQPKSLKFQRAVLSPSELHAIQRIPRDTTTLAFLLILREKADSRGMRKSLHKVPTVLDFALTV